MITHRRSIANLAVCLAFAAGVLDAGQASAADEPARAAAAAKRPRICLVLSGGGARGAAHIGVLRAREALGATANYTKWDAAGTLAHSFGPHTFTVGFRFGGKLGSGELPGYDQFQWGGFLQQSGLPTGALYGGNIAFGRLVYYNRLLHLPFLEGVYAGGSLEVGKVGDPFVPGSPTGTLSSASAFFGLDSLIGPVYLGAGVASNGSSSFYFFLGRP